MIPKSFSTAGEPRWDGRELEVAESQEAAASLAAMDVLGTLLGAVPNAAEAAFDRHFSRVGLSYFRARELRFLGGGHFGSGPARGLNTLPPRALWKALEETAHAADAVREAFGSALRVLSAYRSPAYNRAIGGAGASWHTRARALDLAPANGDVARLYEVAVEARRRGVFTGGIGRYRTFIHIDTRGSQATW